MSKWRKAHNFKVGDALGYLLEILPTEVRGTAIATCRFQLRGLRSNGNEWGLGCITTLQTHGHEPDGLRQLRRCCQHKSGGWIELDSHESGDLILDCFGLTIQDVYEYFGRPNEGERIEIDLVDIIEALAPELVSHNSQQVAV